MSDQTCDSANQPHWQVYVLRCSDGSLYTGITTDIARRIEQHNAGTAAKYTRSRRPAKIVHEETCVTRSAALKRELAIKAMTRREKEALIMQSKLSSRDGETLPDVPRGR